MTKEKIEFKWFVGKYFYDGKLTKEERKKLYELYKKNHYVKLVQNKKMF